MFRRGTSDIPPGPGFNDNVQYHELPRFSRFVGQNGPDTGAILRQNVIPVISVQPILYQLPYGAKKKIGGVIPSPKRGSQKRILIYTNPLGLPEVAPHDRWGKMFSL